VETPQTRDHTSSEVPPSPPRRGRARLAIAAVAAAVVAIAAYLAYDRFVVEPRLAEAAGVGLGVERADVAAPPIDLGALDGGRFSLASARGEVVFVNFWATWCPPCREEMPSMVRLGRELAAKYPGKFRMVAVSVDEGWAPVKEYFGAPPFFGNPGMTVVLDEEQRTTQAYYCTARGGACPALMFPETYIVGKDGRLVAYVVGPRDWSEEAARRFLEALIRS
jgi:thiol-disulfide isomerase/thioredoxin